MPAVNVNELFNDENGLALLKKASRRLITWDEFLEEPLPFTMGTRQTWDSIQTLRRGMGISCPFSVADSGESWYGMTMELGELVARITWECSSSSLLSRKLQQSSDQHFLVGMRVSDALASLELDGLDMSSEAAADLIRFEKTPRNPTERIVWNSFAANGRLSQLTDRPFSREVVRELYDLVVEGVDIDSLAAKPKKLGIVPYVLDIENEDERLAFLDLLIRYANDEAGDPADPAALRCLLIGDLMFAHQPLGKVSGQVGRLLSRLYALKHDLPILSILPHSRARIDWMDGLIEPPAVACGRDVLDRTGSVIFGGGALDGTLHQTLSAQLTCHLLDQLKREIAKWGERDSAMRSALQHDPHLNQRQRAIIARALRSPSCTFSVKYHQTNHSIAYATARRDLVELEEKGYLGMRMRGKAMEFYPGSRLEQLVDVSMGGDAR